MSTPDTEQVRGAILTAMSPSLASAGLDPTAIDPTFDPFSRGVLDSLGLVDLISEVETSLGRTVRVEDLDLDQLEDFGSLVGQISELIEPAGQA